jgi:hypothetical protein
MNTDGEWEKENTAKAQRNAKSAEKILKNPLGAFVWSALALIRPEPGALQPGFYQRP